MRLAINEKEAESDQLAASNTEGLEAALDHYYDLSAGDLCILLNWMALTPPSSAVWLRAFGLPRWHGRDLKTKTNAAENTSSGELPDVPRRALKRTSDQHEDHPKPDSRTSSQAVTHVKACKGSH